MRLVMDFTQEFIRFGRCLVHLLRMGEVEKIMYNELASVKVCFFVFRPGCYILYCSLEFDVASYNINIRII